MLQTIRYTCDGASMREIAEALATHGYTVEIPSQPCASGTTATVLAQGMATVLLLETPDYRTVEIECSGPARDVSAQLLESLPIRLEKDSGVRVAVSGRMGAAPHAKPIYGRSTRE